MLRINAAACADAAFEAAQPVRFRRIAGWVAQIFDNLVGRNEAIVRTMSQSETTLCHVAC